MNSLENLRHQLLKERFPQRYMFKFIVPNSDGKVDLVKSLMPEGQLSFRPSKDLHYVAVTCVAVMNSAQEIIEVSRNALQVEGVLML